MHIVQPLLTMTHNGLMIALGLAGIGFLIGFHELGHFVFCKLFKIRTPSFSIGMGPKVFERKIGQTNFILSALPLGGFVEIAGSAEIGQGDQKEATAQDPGSFASRPYWQKLLVMLGGILFNLIFAYAAITFLYLTGMPKHPLMYPIGATTTISMVQPDSPAIKSGLKEGDTIRKINNEEMQVGLDIIRFVQNNPNDGALFTIQHADGTIDTKTIGITQKQLDSPDIGDQKKEIGYLGIEFEVPRYGLFNSIKLGIKATNHLIYSILKVFKSIFTKNQFNNLGGPILIISQTIKSAHQGFNIFLLLLAFISINLAILNLIPLPIMDGGQILYYTIEAIIRRPIPDKVREYIHIATWIGVLILVVYISFKDICRIFLK